MEDAPRTAGLSVPALQLVFCVIPSKSFPACALQFHLLHVTRGLQIVYFMSYRALLLLCSSN